MAMPRYLTPAKLCLLLLIDLYTSEHIPDSARLDVLSFIASHLNASSYDDQNNTEEKSKVSASDISVFAGTLSQWQSTIPGRTMYDQLLLRVWALNDLDSLHNLFQQVSYLVAPPVPESPESAAAKLSRASPLGQFIRRCCVEFTRLQFSDSQVLWQLFVSYRSSSFDAWASRNPQAARKMDPEQQGSATAGNSDQEPEITTYSSAEDTEYLLNASIHHLQKLGIRISPALKSQLSSWAHDLMDSSTQSLQHFLAFFEHWRSGEYTMALESLHRYFDYSLVGGATDDRSKEGSMKLYYQYALLHLSVLHADFERWEESGDAMRECIATARENQDPACLNFALSYLIHLRQSHPPAVTGNAFANTARLIGGGEGSDQDEISFLKTKAKEGRHWTLLGSTLLEEARGELGGGGSTVKALECILQSQYLDVQHDLRTMMSAGKLFAAAAYERLGQTSLGNHLYEGIELTHALHCPAPDGVRATCRLAGHLAQQGQYDRALDIIGNAKEGKAKGILKLEQRLSTFELLILLRRNVHSESFQAAAYYLEQLRPVRAFGDEEIKLEIMLLEVELLLRRQEYADALKLVNTNMKRLKANPRSAGEPIKGLSIALRAAATAERLLVVPVLVEAIAALSEVLIALREYGAARELLGGGIVWALNGRHTFLIACMFALLAEATVGAAGHECEHGSTEQKKLMRTAGGYIDRSHEAYAQIFDLSGILDTLNMRARVARWNKDEATAAQADEKYLQLLANKMERQEIYD